MVCASVLEHTFYFVKLIKVIERWSKLCQKFIATQLLSLRILDDDDDRVAAQEELRNVAFLVLRPGPLSFALLRHLSPHFKHTLQHHIHVSIEGLHIAKQLAIVATVDQYLAVGLDGLG